MSHQCALCGKRSIGSASKCLHCGAPFESERSRVVAALLAILLGGIGAHKFYTGRVLFGLLYLVFCWTFVPAVLGVIEGLIYLTMSDAKFAARFG